MNHRAKFDAAVAASFILAVKSVTVQIDTRKTNTVTDISTPCLSACEDKKIKAYHTRYQELVPELIPARR